MYQKGAEVKTGLIVLAASLAILGMVFLATGGSFWREWRHVHLRLEVGPLAPRTGDPVFMNGVNVGSVTKVEFRTRTPDRLSAEADESKAPEREIYVWAEAEIDESRVLPKGTTGLIAESITGARSLRLVLGNSMESLTDEDTVAKPIFVRQSPDLSAIAERAAEIADQAKDVVGKVSEVGDEAKAALSAAKRLFEVATEKIERGEIDEALKNVAATTVALRHAVELLDSRAEKIGDDVAAAAADVRRIAAKGVVAADSIETEIPALLKDVRAILAKVDTIVERAAPKLDALFDDAARTAANLASLSEDLKSLGPEASALLEGLGQDVDELGSTLVDTAHNLLDTSEEVKARPWRLLNADEEEQVAYDNVRSTMQSYVKAMTRMDLAANTLRELLARGEPQDPRTRRLVQRTLAEFERSVDRYRTLEARLLDLLQQSRPGRPPQGAPPPPR